MRATQPALNPTAADAWLSPRVASAIVVVAACASLAAGFAPMPLWDEDEPRFAAIARGMLDSGDSSPTTISPLLTHGSKIPPRRGSFAQ